jgi:hypothetical protein
MNGQPRQPPFAALALTASTLLAVCSACSASPGASAACAPFGTEWPGRTPELFAPGVVNSDAIEINLVFDMSMTELFFARRIDGVFAILTARLGPDGWTHPEELELFPDDPSIRAVDMALSPDERALYFLGIAPGVTEGEADRRDIWVSDRTAAGWSPARLVPAPVSTEHGESYPVLTADGSLWFLSDRPESRGPRDLYRARPAAGGGFETPVSIDPPINTDTRKGDTLVAPDESYIVTTSSLPGGHGSSDLYIAFRTEDGGWTELRNMGPEFNGPEVDFCPMVSPDGRWFSFSRRYGSTWDTTTDAEIYWVDASALDELRLDQE